MNGCNWALQSKQSIFFIVQVLSSQEIIVGQFPIELHVVKGLDEFAVHSLNIGISIHMVLGGVDCNLQ